MFEVMEQLQFQQQQQLDNENIDKVWNIFFIFILIC